MAEEKTKQKVEVKKTEKPVETKAVETLSEEKKVEEVKSDVKPAVKETPKITKKDEAIAKGNNLHASMKQCMYICKFIKGKSIDEAIANLEAVTKMKKVIPYKGEIPHRSEPGVMSGRYPINASKIFIPMLKGLKGNVLANQMDLDKSRITFASATWASRPSKRGGGRFKRTNVVLKATEVAK